MSLFVNVFFSWPHLYATYKGNEVAKRLHTLCCHHTSCGLNKEQKQKKRSPKHTTTVEKGIHL